MVSDLNGLSKMKDDDARLSMEEIKWALNNIKANTPAGVINIALRTIKQLFNRCPEIFLDTFNREYMCGSFSSLLKYSKATILPKS